MLARGTQTRSMPCPKFSIRSSSSIERVFKVQTNCHLDRAVQIEKGLRAKSPENGNITQIGWRLSAISREGCRFSGRGDTPHNARKPIFSGLFVIWLRTILNWMTSWLTWQDSNPDIPRLQTPFEISKEFRTFSRKSGLETSGTIFPAHGTARLSVPGSVLKCGVLPTSTRRTLLPTTTNPRSIQKTHVQTSAFSTRPRVSGSAKAARKNTA
jgi:hypothetical protein